MFKPLHFLPLAALVGGVALFPSGHAAARAADTDVGATFFENRVRPVLVERCYQCHSTEKGKSKGDLTLDSREGLLKGGSSGPAVVPGDPEASPLIRAVRGRDKELRMPPGKAEGLTQAQVQDFVAWVKMGASFPAGTAPKSSPDSAEAMAAARRFWSFQRVQRPALPAVRHTNWPQDPIDTFVLAKLEEKGLSPAPVADRRTLLRRASYDLTGLPPTPEELDAFLADTGPDAFARAVDRLLASPQYGEHWGRHWLDIARYADTRWVGAGEDRRFPFAYTYRDWVVQALNGDMPYDRFVTLQLAADQVPDVERRDLAALGFLTVGRWFTGNVHEIIDDQIDVVTRGFLGLTVQCARCHDHKYDPIPTKDYYSLYGLFAASRMPVDGSGTIPNLPVLADRPLSTDQEQQFTVRREQLDRFLQDRQQSVRTGFAIPEKLAEYLLAATDVMNKPDKDIRAFAKAEALNENVLFRWVRLLKRTVKDHPVFGPWHDLASLPETEFAAKAAATVEAARARKLNPHVAALLTPPPSSMKVLARHYARLLAKFDRAETWPSPEEETLRQVLRNNDSPVQLAIGELGPFLSQEEKDRVLGLRRSLLQDLAKLSESADQFWLYQRETTPLREEVTHFLEARRQAIAAEVSTGAKIADYLLAARDARGISDAQLRALANDRKLHEGVLRRWMNYLQRGADRDDAVFAAWRAFAALADKEFAEQAVAVTERVKAAARNRRVTEAFPTTPASLREVALAYGNLIISSRNREGAADADDTALRLVATGTDSPLTIDREAVVDLLTRKETDELRNKETRWIRLALDHPGTPPHGMVLRESARGYAQKIFVRGNPAVPGGDAPGSFLSVLADGTTTPFEKGKGRRQLAQAIVAPSNPLTARVLVNRVWSHYFGEGLVRTPSDFGVRGDRPSHPELLDWLAAQLVEDGWSMKKLHRRIVLSATYQQASDNAAAARKVDPENRLLGRMNRRRLCFEELRDSLLAAAGQLDRALGGRPVSLSRQSVHRRTVYGTVDRVNLPGLYRSFDFPGSDAHTPQRHETLIPQQALYLMNDAFVMDQAAQLIQRPEMRAEGSPEGRIAALYRLVYGRRPTGAELGLGMRFVDGAPLPTHEEKADPWRYGFGHYDETRGRVVTFQTFPFFGNNVWRGGPQENDPELGRIRLDARGGNAGNDPMQAVIRRWVAPRDGTVSISGVLNVQQGSLQPSGDGVRGRVVSSRRGQLGTWIAWGTEESTVLEAVAVQQGDTIDFVVDGRGRETFAGGFSWAPVLRMRLPADEPTTSKPLWDAAKDFSGSPATARQAGVWERYAQVLLEANEFIYLD